MTSNTRAYNWNNAITGLGSAMRDKVQHTQFSASQTLSDETLESLYHNDDMAARVCDVVPDEMLRQGFDIEINDDPDAAAAIHETFKLLNAREKLNEALVWARVFGGSAIFVGVDDTRDPSQPLQLSQAKSLRFLTVLDKRDLSPSAWYTDPLERNFGQVKSYHIASNERFASATEIHESRLLVFHGTRTSKRQRQKNGGWSLSILQRMYEVMQQFNSSWQATSHLMNDAAQAVFKLKGLHAQIGANKTSELLQRLEIIDMSRSVARAVLLDADDEDFHRDTYSFAGVPQILDKMMLRLAAAARMPVSLLMGQSAAGLNATGDSDIRFFYDQIKAQQETTLRPKLERLVQIIMACQFGPTKGNKTAFQISFPALWQQTEREKAEIRRIQAETDAKYIQEGVLLPEEVAVNRFSGDGSINLAERNLILAAK